MPIPANVETLLKQSDTGVAALAFFNANAIEIETTNAGAIAWFDPSGAKKKIVLNTSKPAAVVAAYFCHEINHARMFVNGTTADPKKETKDDYVKKMVKEEADGTTLGFRSFLELERKGLTTGVNPPDRYDMYKRAFENGRKAKKEKDPNATEAEMDAMGFSYGARMVKYCIDERFLGPNSIESYSEYYARDWAQQNRKK